MMNKDSNLRKAFKDGDFIEAMSLMEELEEDQLTLGVNLFLKYRPQVYAEIQKWAKSVLDCPNLFLPKALWPTIYSGLFDDIERFNKLYKEDIEKALEKHPDKLKREPSNVSDIRKAINIWGRNRDFLDHLDYQDDFHLVSGDSIPNSNAVSSAYRIQQSV